MEFELLEKDQLKFLDIIDNPLNKSGLEHPRDEKSIMPSCFRKTSDLNGNYTIFVWPGTFERRKIDHGTISTIKNTDSKGNYAIFVW
ncbi:unnamed protein product [Caenorhabditis angaria]|uniref:Uncharacterized protein n=1 Tax=Caenorhabditis angaria TaxID=860376 RepID=A0A9P1ISL7_9PELO|nr:unnamed protein product [Caenorhabditis angaria]